MSRYAFIAAATLFTGLLVVLTMAIAQRDSRVSRTISDLDANAYSAVLAKPIVVSSDALGPDGGLAPSLPPRVALPELPTEFPLEIPQPLEASGPTLPGAPDAFLIAEPFVSAPFVSGEPTVAGQPTDPYEPLMDTDSIRTDSIDVAAPVALASGQVPANPVAEPPKFDASRIVAPKPRSDSVPTLLPPGGMPPTVPPPSVALPPIGLPPLPELAAPAAPFSAPVASPPSLGNPAPISPAPISPVSPAPAAIPNTFKTPAPVLPDTAPQPLASQPMASQSPVPESLAPSMDPPSLTGRQAPGWAMSTSTPGSRQFEGSQNPSLEIHKRAPAEVQVGVPTSFTAVVRNVGNATAFDVQVTDAIPKGARLVRTFPESQRVGNDGLAWNLGELAAGQEATISMEIVPETEGELGSVASVKFAAQASVRTISTQPRLTVKQTAVAEMLGGDSATILIDVMNTGTGVARDVRLEEDVPKVFRHVSGASALQHDVGDLAPGESLRFEIELMALEAGKVSNVVRATSANSAMAESSYPIEVKAPKLQLQIVGPKLRHLERPAPYEAVIENSGTAVAKDLYITARLPRGMNFISASNEGTYLPDQHSVVWNLMELAAGTKAKTELVLLPVEEGRFAIAMTTDAEGARADPTEREVLVEGQSELTFEIDDDNDPIEVAGMTTYSVRINNIGTRPDTEVRLAIEAPEGTTIEQVSSPMKYQVSGRQVIFAAIPSLASKQQVVVKVGVKHTREGTQVLRASLQSQLRAVPVIKDESTQVYRDQ
jgi:uncharacterized repeat protein (TIGR01451 family)